MAQDKSNMRGLESRSLPPRNRWLVLGWSGRDPGSKVSRHRHFTPLLILVFCAIPALAQVRPSQIPTRLIKVPGDPRSTSAIPVRQMDRQFHYEAGWPWLCFSTWYAVEASNGTWYVNAQPTCFTEYGECLYRGGTAATCAGKSQAERPLQPIWP